MSSGGPASGDTPKGEGAKSTSIKVQRDRISFPHLAKEQGPPSWQGEPKGHELADIALNGRPQAMIVMAADVRKSTLVMKEAIDFKQYADSINDFVNVVDGFIQDENGWFDKFTGDGFLAFWLHNEEDWASAATEAIGTADFLVRKFAEVVVPALRRNSRNFPGGVGLCVGMDSGLGNLALVGRRFTVIGAPVVGAVRMVSVALTPEIICNVHFATRITEKRKEVLYPFTMVKDLRRTKEYESQEVYLLNLPERSPAVPTGEKDTTKSARPGPAGQHDSG